MYSILLVPFLSRWFESYDTPQILMYSTEAGLNVSSVEMQPFTASNLIMFGVISSQKDQFPLKNTGQTRLSGMSGLWIQIMQPSKNAFNEPH